MSGAVAHIVEELEHLTEAERAELYRVILRRVASEDLTDDDFAALAAESFRVLDAEAEGRP
jgi:hypothetical protein